MLRGDVVKAELPLRDRRAWRESSSVDPLRTWAYVRRAEGERPQPPSDGICGALTWIFVLTLGLARGCSAAGSAIGLGDGVGAAGVTGQAAAEFLDAAWGRRRSLVAVAGALSPGAERVGAWLGCLPCDRFDSCK